jgi:hypothetical protein
VVRAWHWCALGWGLLHASACYGTSGRDGDDGPSGGSGEAGASSGATAGSAGASANGGSNPSGGTAGSGTGGSDAGSTSIGEAGATSGGDGGADGSSAGAGGSTAGAGASGGDGGTSGAAGTSGAGATGPGEFVGVGGQLSVSSGFYLHEPRSVEPATTFVGPAMACTAEGCLVAYGQTIGGRVMVLASRIAPTGAVLDKIVLSAFDDVNADVWRVQVAAGDDEYLVYTETEETQGTTVRRHRFYIVGADGAVRATSTTLIDPLEAGSVHVHGGGENFLVRYKNPVHRIQLVSSELGLVGAPVEDTFTNSPPPSVAFGAAGYLLADGQYAGCVSDTNASAPGVQVYWQYGDPTSHGPLLATDSGYVLLGTRNSAAFTRDTYAIRFDETCSLVDGDDDFNQISGGTLLCEDCGGTAESALWLGSYGLASVRQDEGVGLFRFGLAPFERIGGVLHAELEWTDPAPSRFFSLGDDLLALDRAKVLRFGSEADPFDLALENEAIAVPFSADIEEVSVAFAGDRFLVAGANMTPTFVALDGELEPVAGVDPDSGGQVADDGSSYLLTQQAGGQVTARRISASGAPDAANSIAYSSSDYNDDFRLTSTDDTYLLTALNSSSVQSHAVSGIRIAADGSFIDEGREIFRFNSAIYGVLGDSFPDARYRSYGVFGSQGETLEWLRVRSQSGSIIAPAKWLPATHAPAFASDGYSFLVAYQAPDGGVLGTYAALLSPDSGDPHAEPSALAGFPGYTRGAWSDGLVFYVGSMEGDTPTADPHKRFAIRRFDRQLAALDAGTPAGYAVVPDKFHPFMTEAPALGSNGDGLSLIAYQYADPVYGGVALKGVFLKNDMARPTFSPATCDEIDFLDFGGDLLEEGADSGDGTPVCDPTLYAYAVAPVIGLEFAYDFVRFDPYDPAMGNHSDRVSFYLHGPLPSSLPATYTISPTGDTAGTATVLTSVDSGSAQSCSGQSGTVTLTALGPIGGQVQGSFSIDALSGTACPSGARSGTFGVTRTE